MRGKIDCFMACAAPGGMAPLVTVLRDSRTVHDITLVMTAAQAADGSVPEGCAVMTAGRMTSSETIREVAARATAD